VLATEWTAKGFRARKFTAGMYVDNIGSTKAFKKAGFIVECIRHGQLLLDDIPTALVLMGKFVDRP
jgi:hypothetical protein